jgi:hypothetical protein
MKPLYILIAVLTLGCNAGERQSEDNLTGLSSTFKDSSVTESSNTKLKILNRLLSGTWTSVDDVECADAMVFQPGNSYMIYNDCYGDDPMDPLVEKGLYQIHESEEELILTERAFTTNYTAFSPGRITLQITRLTKDTLHLKNDQGREYRYVSSLKK